MRQLTYGQFSPSPDGGSFSVNISWEKPTFNYSTLVSYKISYSKGSNNDTNVELFVVSCTASISSLKYFKYLSNDDDDNSDNNNYNNYNNNNDNDDDDEDEDDDHGDDDDNSFQVNCCNKILFRHAPHYGIIMHTS